MKIVVGNTGMGYYKELEDYDKYIDLRNIPELSIIRKDLTGIETGAAVTISKAIEEGNEAFLALVSHCKNPVERMLWDCRLAFDAYGTKHSIRVREVEEFLYGKLLSIVVLSYQDLIENQEHDQLSQLKCPTLLSSSKQLIQFNNEYKPVGEPITKIGGVLQASGEAIYVDDIPSPNVGQRIAFGVADTQKRAGAAANLAVIDYDKDNLEPPILPIEEAIERSSFYTVPPFLYPEQVGDFSKGMAEADHRILSAGVATACALAAYKLHRPVRMYLDRKTDMIMAGGRHPMKITYGVGFKANGKITALKLDILIDAGMFVDASYIAEVVIEHVAPTLGMDVDAIRNVNLHTHKSLDFFFSSVAGEPLEYTLPLIWDKLATSSSFYNTIEMIKEFNQCHTWQKRGISRVPIVHEVVMRSTPRKVSILRDGSIVVEVGGIEMGQGLWTKVKQMTAYGLSLVKYGGVEQLLEKVRVIEADSLSMIQGGFIRGKL
ncbi:Aldehyde oxidase/xanthine dehydrogenase, a/b hammerhead [Corchorus capsularis]|uniref:Aldehyde oxidase/xanthine dehydrogenase, a/b hammerhead n=1 Tax=Corchorus capsularis TaxID=210143 RepID=A0A1R3HL87_COCAP|nr:Aldehyde oxidase/xanthine dehydrogenase, a/b hammerhead [Corchorus capsularis]